MARSSRKEKKKQQNGTKVRPAKRSKFSINNNDSIYAQPKNPPGSGCPTNYLYGKQAVDARKIRKRSNIKQKNKSSFVARKGNKKGKRLFIARFPVIGISTKAVPWLKRKQPRRKDDKTNQIGEKQQHRKIVNAFSVNAAALQHFNQELLEFVTYVRLNRTEIELREYMIQQIQKSCKNLFGVEDSQCQVFGSFAAQPVCIFESDIDLAIWGVVVPDDDNDNNDNANYTRQQLIAKRDHVILQEEQTRSNRKKQERVLQWKALIDNATKDAQQDEQLQKDAPEDPVTERKISVDESEDIESSLFVLDRTGDISTLISGRKGDCLEGDASLKSHNNDAHEDSDCGDDDDDNGNGNNCDSESDGDSVHDDSADKLENFWSRKRHDKSPTMNNVGADITNAKNLLAMPDSDVRIKNCNENDYDDDYFDDTSTDEEEIDGNDVPKRRPRGQSLVSLSSSTTCSVEAKLDESGMEVSFVVEANKHTAREKIGPSGRTRTLVVNSLYKLTRPLRPFASQMHVRRKARVPIINMVTHFGFECDIALGGHNGTDTSSYASTQLSRFKSFPIIVVVLKILLSQQGLDKPFTGGLGSYSLYVLVASHIERHLALGGDDNPAEVLYAFFFRYGAVQHSNPKISSSCRTLLSQKLVIKTQDGGSADMKSCFQIENCVTVFEACWRMLQKRLSGNFNQNYSILQFMIDAMKLELDRSQSKKQADSKLKEVCGGKKNQKDTNTVSYSTATNVGMPREEKMDANADDEARELIKGYGQNVETFIPVEEISKQRTTTKSKKKKKKRSDRKPVSSVILKSKHRRTI